MAASIRQARAGVERALHDLISTAETHTGSFDEFERALWSQLLGMGRTLVELFLTCRVRRLRAVRYQHDGRVLVLGELRTSELGTRFGKVPYTRPVGRQPSSPRGAADLPLDRELGLVGGFSLGTVVLVTRLCAQMAFASARSTFATFCDWAPSPRAALRMVDALGAHARAFLEQALAPQDDGEILLIQADGGGAPMISSAEHRRRCTPRSKDEGTKRASRKRRRRARPQKRRTKGAKSKNAKVAFVGIIYSLRRTRAGLEGPINKRLYATFESHRALFQWLRREADKRGYGTKRCLFLADGSDHIWRCQQEFFLEAEVCLDWYHVVEKVWIAGTCLHREGSDELRQWVEEQKRLLRRGAVKRVIATIAAALAATPKTGPGNAGRRERLGEVLRHFIEHQRRMRYHVLRRDGLDIGSGAIEGAVRNLVRMRLDGPGMRWGRDRAEYLLLLRCILLNGQWAEFADYLATRQITLAATPRPARTHDAIPQVVARAA